MSKRKVCDDLSSSIQKILKIRDSDKDTISKDTADPIQLSYETNLGKRRSREHDYRSSDDDSTASDVCYARNDNHADDYSTSSVSSEERYLFSETKDTPTPEACLSFLPASVLTQLKNRHGKLVPMLLGRYLDSTLSRLKKEIEQDACKKLVYKNHIFPKSQNNLLKDCKILRSLYRDFRWFFGPP